MNEAWNRWKEGSGVTCDNLMLNKLEVKIYKTIVHVIEHF